MWFAVFLAPKAEVWPTVHQYLLLSDQQTGLAGSRFKGLTGWHMSHIDAADLHFTNSCLPLWLGFSNWFCDLHKIKGKNPPRPKISHAGRYIVSHSWKGCFMIPARRALENKIIFLFPLNISLVAVRYPVASSGFHNQGASILSSLWEESSDYFYDHLPKQPDIFLSDTIVFLIPSQAQAFRPRSPECIKWTKELWPT